jgi:trimeric autotransporter adhesin
MNENAPLRSRIPADDSRLRANWRAVHAFNRVTSNEINKKMKNLIGSINRSPLRCGFFTMTIALACFALSPPLKAVDCPSACGAGGNTAVGIAALDSVTTGINNAAVGANALTADTTGAYNVAIGSGALADNTTGFQNMAIGAGALANNVVGNFNMAIGFRALFMNTGGRNVAVGAAALSNNAGAGDNTAIGSQAMIDNTTSEFNVAVGNLALTSFNGTGAGDGANTALGSIALNALTSGQENVAVGRRALETSTSGSNNVAVGWRAGDDVLTSNDVVCLGSDSCQGTSSADNVVCIGSGSSGENFNNRAYIPNIGQFAQNSGGGVEFVTVRLSDGKLGHSLSSRRYKEDIKSMGDASELIYKLKPVTFRNKEVDVDPKKGPQPQNLDYGLIAEDVAEIDPKLAIRNGKGEVESLRYMAIYNMMLNEFLKEHQKVEEQQASIADLKSTVALQQKEMQVLTAQLKEQAAQIQKVSAQLEASRPVPKVVANK